MADISVVSKAKCLDSDWSYCGVKLTIHNIIIPEERRNPTPSQLDNMDIELETELRIIGCELIQDSGALLRLPQVAMATAQVLYQRFFYSKSFVRHFYEHYAMACIFLSSKLEECPRRIRDVINVFHHIRQIREQRVPTPVILDQSYSNLKNQVIKAERRILKELGFCVHAKHPHKLIICYLRILEQETNAQLVQTAWNFMNDSLRTDLFVRYLPEAIACACIYLASCKLGIPLPRHPAWWEMFTVDEESVHEISLCLVRLYARPKPCVADIEAELAKLRDELVESKKRELELKKVTQTEANCQVSDQGSADMSPNNITEKLSLSSQDARKADDPKTLEKSGRLPPTSLLANAIATAKAVAANISASKSAVCSDPDQRHASSPHNAVGGQNDPFDRSEVAQPAKRRHSPGASSKKKHNAEIAASGRPAAYPDVFPADHVHRKRRHGKHRNGKRYSSRRSSSRSVSTSGSNSDEDRGTALPPSAYSNPYSRQYRQNRSNLQPNITHSTSESETPTSSPSPIKRKKVATRNRSRSRTYSTSSVTSTSSVDDVRRSHNRKKHRRKTRPHVSPPAAYHRMDKYQDSYVEHRHRLSTKPNVLENGGSRHVDGHRHHRHNDLLDRRNTVISRDHKRR